MAPPLPAVKSFHLVYCQGYLERQVHFRNFRTADAANDGANEIYDRWLWCNVCPLHCLTISKKLQSLVAGFSKLDRWPRKKRGSSFLEKEAEFYHMLTSCLMFFSTTLHSEDVWREHKLRMTEDDYSFYHV